MTIIFARHSRGEVGLKGSFTIKPKNQDRQRDASGLRPQSQVELPSLREYKWQRAKFTLLSKPIETTAPMIVAL
jgi:hypothetical protein